LKNFLILAFGIIFTAIVVSYYLSAFAQVVPNNTTTNVNLTQTISTKFLGIEVLFESPQTLILRGEPTEYQFGSGNLWEAVDVAKKVGYKIDAVAQVTEESSAIGNTRYLSPVYTIFFSK
jgi:hypothetical protein